MGGVPWEGSLQVSRAPVTVGASMTEQDPSLGRPGNRNGNGNRNGYRAFTPQASRPLNEVGRYGIDYYRTASSL